ncbi:sensor histidine kinase, partial [Veillonella atypica]|nr:sensor histidine kinase [Veillonella atypica]
RYTNPVAHRQWMMLAPSTIQAQVFQLGLEQINKELSTESTSISDILDSSAVLEAQGLNIVILENNQVAYSTSGLEVDGLLKNFDTTMDASGSVHYLNWQG